MDFDAIVVGSGMSGGWVAKELCERGFKTLVIPWANGAENVLAITRVAPAYMKPRDSPIRPSPRISFPRPVSHALKTTRSTGKFKL